MKREYLHIAIAIAATSFLWWSFHKPKNFTLEKVKKELKISEALKKSLEIENDSLQKIILDLKKEYQEYTKEEREIIERYEKIRNSPISDTAADSMLRAIIERGRKGFRKDSLHLLP